MRQPKALLKRLTQYIETHLADDPYLGTAPAHDSRPEAQRIRRLFLAEAETLRQYLTEAMKGHNQLLVEMITALKRNTDEQLRDDASELHNDLIAIRRALYRLLLARQARTELLSEWNDWKRHAEFSGERVFRPREERQEMLASELRLRGVRIPGYVMDEPYIPLDEAVRNSPTIIPVIREEDKVTISEPKDSLQSDWHEVLESFENTLPESEWEDVIEACLSPAAHPRSASAVLRSARRHQGHQAKRKRKQALKH
ncbi:hypothetical protein IT407_04275 [Candidatus Uhrbacteria bacterium]|nr:hypothetical protein [Candidatus Uhrbacteria bacterium]